MLKNIRFSKLIGLIVVSIIAILLCSFSSILVYANDSDVAIVQEIDIQEYTSNDRLINEDGSLSSMNIEDFSLYVNNLLLTSSIENIEKVIPKRYLESEQMHSVLQYNGLEYGVYLIKSGECFDFLLIDFNYDSLNEYEYRMSIKPILQVSFQRTYVAGEYRYTKISNESRSKYFVANPRFLTLILNENQLNYGDDGYSKANDTGMIIRQSRFNYGSMLYKTEEDLIAECAKFGANIVYDTVLKVIDIASPGVGELTGYVVDAIAFGAKLYFEGNHNEYYVADNENNILSNVTRDAQASNNNVDGFTRVAGIAAQSEIILCDDDNSYAEFIVMLEGADTKTRLIQLCDFEIATRVGDWSSMDYIKDSDGNNQVFSTGKEQTLFEDASVKAISYIKHQSSHLAYFLDNGSQTFTYYAPATSIYQFSSAAQLSDIEITCQGNAVETTVLDENTVEVKLESGKQYTFVFSQSEAGFYTFNFGRKTTAVNIGDTLDVPLLAYDESVSYLYTGPEIDMNSVVQITYEDSLYDVTVYYEGSTSIPVIEYTDLCQIVVDPGVEYYIEIKNRSSRQTPPSTVKIELPTTISLNETQTEQEIRGVRYYSVYIPVQGNYRISNLSQGLSAYIAPADSVDGVYELDAGYYYVQINGTDYSASLSVKMVVQDMRNEAYESQAFVGGAESAFIKYVCPENAPIIMFFSGARIAQRFSENMEVLSDDAPFEKGKTYYIRVIPISGSKLPAQFYGQMGVAPYAILSLNSDENSSEIVLSDTGEKWVYLNVLTSGIYHFYGSEEMLLFNKYIEQIDSNSFLTPGNYLLKVNNTKLENTIGASRGGERMQLSDMVVIAKSRTFEYELVAGKQYEIRIAGNFNDIIVQAYNSNWESISLSQNGNYYTFTANDTLIYVQVLLSNTAEETAVFMIDELNATIGNQIVTLTSDEPRSWSVTENGRYFIIPAGEHTLYISKKIQENIALFEITGTGASAVLYEIKGEDAEHNQVIEYSFSGNSDKTFVIFTDAGSVDMLLYDTNAEYYIKVAGQATGSYEFVVGNYYELELHKLLDGVDYKVEEANKDYFSVFVNGVEVNEKDGKFAMLNTGLVSIFVDFFGIKGNVVKTVSAPSVDGYFAFENGELIFRTKATKYTSNLGYEFDRLDITLNGQKLGTFDEEIATLSLKNYYHISLFSIDIDFTFSDGTNAFTVSAEKFYEWENLYIGNSISGNLETVYIDAKSPTNTNIGNTLVIPKSTKIVFIEGDGTLLTNFNIYVSDRDDGVTIYLNNVKYQFDEYGINCDSFVSLSLDITGDCSIMPMFDAFGGGVAIHANHLTINGTGELTVVSAKIQSVTGNAPVYSGYPGINVNTIKISVNRLTVIGGDGGDAGDAVGIEYADMNDGKSAKTGGTGGCAIFCNTDFIVTESCTYLRLIGGIGGNGGRGADGKNATAIGEAGGRGGHGGDGGLGGVPYDIINEDSIFYISNETELLLVNGAYGLGGDGGNGGNGGPGGNGGNGGNGGDGLYGGVGGNGGHGGHGPSDEQFFGESTPGGSGGNGGHGGHGGYSYATESYTCPGDGGNGGNGGDPGIVGAGTNGGNGGYGFRGGHGGNGSDAHGVFADAGDGGNGGDGYGNDAGEGGNGGDAAIASNDGKDGADGQSYTNWDNYPWNY